MKTTNTFKKAIAGLMAFFFTLANTAALAQNNIGAEDLIQRTTSVINQMTGNGVQIFDSAGKELSASEVIHARDFYIKSPECRLVFRARMSRSGDVSTIALGAYDSIGVNRLAARTVLIDPTKSHAENNLLIDQTIQSLAQQVERYAKNESKQGRSIAQEKIALPFVSLIKTLVGLGILYAAMDVVLEFDSMKGKKLLKTGGAAVALALGYVILDRFFTDAH